MSDSTSVAKYDHAIQRAFAELHRHSELQFSLPEYKPPVLQPWVLALLKFLRDEWVYLKWGFWGIAALILTYVIYVLVRRYWPLLLKRRKVQDAHESVANEEWRPTPVAARRLLSESDALAAQGRYSEAIHLLLLRSIEDIEDRRPRLVRPMFTSREIAELDPLPRSARAAFAGIAAAVERGLFAGQKIGADEFARCRRDYESFAFAPAWIASADS